MKYLIRVLFFILILFSAISIVHSAAKTFGDTNIRDVPCIGFRVADTKYEKDGDWITRLYNNNGYKEMLETHPQAFEKASLCMMRKIKWKYYYVDHGKAPTSRAQAQDPNWENYRWNTDDDTIGYMLNHELVTSGKLKILIGFASTSSEQSNSPPDWFLDNEDYWYGETKYGRWDNQEVVDHIADFQIAFVKKYGNHENLAGIQFGEYYRGDYTIAPGWNYDRYFLGKVDLWKQVTEATPLYDDGTRVAFYQINPILRGGATKEHMIEYGVGISRSDSPMFSEGCGANGNRQCAEGTVGRLIQDLEGIVPNMIMGDAKWSFIGKKVKWNGYPNPFGHGAGYEAVASPQELMWFYGSKGLTPLNSIFMNTDNGEDPYNKENYIDGVGKFGPGGSLVDEWGMIPAHFDEDSVQYDDYWSGEGYQSSNCYQIKVGNAIPNGFASPYDFDTNRLFFRGTCDSNSIKLKLDGSQTIYTYKNGYYWDGLEWKLVELNGNRVGNSVWISGDASATISNVDISNNNYVLAYSCKWTGSEWKCGCQNSACNSPAWNLQVFGIQLS